MSEIPEDVPPSIASHYARGVTLRSNLMRTLEYGDALAEAAQVVGRDAEIDTLREFYGTHPFELLSEGQKAFLLSSHMKRKAADRRVELNEIYVAEGGHTGLLLIDNGKFDFEYRNLLHVNATAERGHPLLGNNQMFYRYFVDRNELGGYGVVEVVFEKALSDDIYSPKHVFIGRL